MKTLIRNGMIVDGLGGKPYRADLMIDGKTIAEIAPHIEISGSRVPDAGAANGGRTPGENICGDTRILDAAGQYVTPGFIDIHRHADAAVFRKDFGKPEIRQGLTSIVNGNCGLSVVPLSPKDSSERISFLEPVTGSLDGCRFEKFSEYMEALKKVSPPVECGMLVGTGSVRAAVCGQENHSPSSAELRKMHEYLEDAFSSGALGISMGIEYEPECFCRKEDFISQLEPAKGSGVPLIMHVRSEGDSLHEALEEAVSLADALDLPLHISHIKCIGKRNWHSGSADSLAILDRARADGADVSCDVYPYTAGSTQLLQIIPKMLQSGGLDATLDSLRDPAVRRKLDELFRIPSMEFDNFVEMEGWENISVSSVASEKNRDCVGKSMTEIAEMRGVSPLDAACSLLIDEHGAVTMIDTYACEEDVRKFLACPYSNIISDSLYAEAGMPHPRLYGSFTRVLEKYVKQEKLFPIETAVRKMTSMPASVVHLNRKGILKKGMDADILVFSPDAVRENATYENPKQFGSGFSHIFIGGTEADLS